jgi:ribosomal protein S13
MSNTTTTLFKLLDLGEKASNEVCNNPTKTNCNKLEQITKLTQDELQRIKNLRN